MGADARNRKAGVNESGQERATGVAGRTALFEAVRERDLVDLFVARLGGAASSEVPAGGRVRVHRAGARGEDVVVVNDA